MPRIGFGSYKIRGQTCKDAVLAALAAGYRHIDSAALYRNKVRVREAIEQSGVPREDVFLTTKVGSPRRKEAQGEVYQDVVETVDRIAGEDGYVDLLLIHVPGPSREHRQRLWEAMERVKKEGRAKSIGVSNFRVRHLEELREYATEWPPSVNQIEVSHDNPDTKKEETDHRTIATYIAPPMVSATRSRSLLQGQWHCCRGIQPACYRHSAGQYNSSKHIDKA